MGLFDIGKVCLFSATTGVVTLDGAPLAGVEVERAYKWQGTEYTRETATTDAEGRFAFPAAYGRSVAKYTPVEPVVHQRILLRREGREYLAWERSKRDYDEDTELEGKKIDLRCDLSNEVRDVQMARGVVSGLCTWE